jgi:hypothetical protein
LEPGHTHPVIRIDHIHQVMLHTCAFIGTRLRGSHIHAPVHLIGVGIHDFATVAILGKRIRQSDAKTGFAGSGWTYNRYHPTAARGLQSIIAFHAVIIRRQRSLIRIGVPHRCHDFLPCAAVASTP